MDIIPWLTRELSAQGPIMWTLYGVAVLSLAAILDRAFFWLSMRTRRESWHWLRRATASDAVAAVGRIAETGGRRDYLVRVARAGRQRPLGHEHAAVEAQRQLDAMDCRMSLLDWSVTTAPLLGILGTGIGVAFAFQQNGSGLPDPGVLGQGISMALTTTIWGLSISIIAATARSLFRGLRRGAVRRLERLIELIDNAHSGQQPIANRQPA
jgi:biopolymer transport protein ExbB